MSARRPSAGAQAFVRWTLVHGRWLWLVALLLGVPAGLRTAHLYRHLRSDLEALLPREAASVLAIDELRRRVPGLQHLGVVIDTGNAASLPAGERLARDLAARVRSYPGDLVRDVRVGVADEKRFLQRFAPLYADLGDLRSVRARIDARRDYEVSRESGLLLDESEPPPPLDFADLAHAYDRKTAAYRLPRDRFSNEALHTTVLLIDVAGFSTGRARGEELLARVRSDLDSLGGPERYAPGMSVGYAGDVAISVEETSALMADLSFSSVAVVSAVILVIVAYYRWWRSVVVLLPPLLLAAVCAFALASLPPFGITELNSNTAFLGSIIVGNGINFGIILLARYVEERRAGMTVDGALAATVGGARQGTLMAALASGAAYASLVLTDFQGFRQFGVIGGLGMILSWIATFVLMPPLIAWVDTGERWPVGGRARGRVMGGLGSLLARRPRIVAMTGLALVLFAAWRVRGFGGNEIETDFSRLRRADTWTNGEGAWGRKMDAVLGTYLTPAVLLGDRPEQARAVARDLAHEATREPMRDELASIRTLEDVLPAEQDAKIAEIDAIRVDLTPRIRALVPPSDRGTLDSLLADGPFQPLTVGDLPDTLTMGLVESDGTYGRTVLAFPRPSRTLWQGPALARFVDGLRAAARAGTAPDGRPARVASSLALSADIVALIRRDGPRVSAIAFLGVLAIVWGVLRQTRLAALVACSLAVAVLFLAALAMVLQVRVNFANFIAYPITFGIGVDYSVNIASRYLQDGGDDIARILRSTGGAVALCSLTTILGYSSLLLAQNRALFLFGVLAVLGEVCCLFTALVLLPAVLMLREASVRARARAEVAS